VTAGKLLPHFCSELLKIDSVPRVDLFVGTTDCFDRVVVQLRFLPILHHLFDGRFNRSLAIWKKSGTDLLVNESFQFRLFQMQVH
jgi:hypothetical protein